MVIGLPAKQLSLRLVGSSPTLSENKSSGEFSLSAWLAPTMSPAERGPPLSGGGVTPQKWREIPRGAGRRTPQSGVFCFHALWGNNFYVYPLSAWLRDPAQRIPR